MINFMINASSNKNKQQAASTEQNQRRRKEAMRGALVHHRNFSSFHFQQAKQTRLYYLEVSAVPYAVSWHL
jgi:hypothetical protein